MVMPGIKFYVYDIFISYLALSQAMAMGMTIEILYGCDSG